MIFSLDVRRARKGDCLLLHYGTKTKPRLMLIDGGPSDVYKPHLEPRIQEIRKKRKLDDVDSLTVDHMMVSHVDDDHIRGLIDLTGEEIVRQDAHEPLLLNVLNLWHNSFDAVINHTPDELTASLTKQFGAAALTVKSDSARWRDPAFTGCTSLLLVFQGRFDANLHILSDKMSRNWPEPREWHMMVS